MARLSNNQWLEIKVKFETGKYTSRELASEYGCSHVAILNKSKKDNWEYGKTYQTLQGKSSSIKELVKMEKESYRQLSKEEKPIFDKEVLKFVDIQNKATNVLDGIFNLQNQAMAQVEQIIKNNPTGLYIKSQSDNSIVYGRNTEFIKDLMAVSGTVEKIVNPKSNEPTTQVNVQQNNTPPVINIQPVKILNKED